MNTSTPSPGLTHMQALSIIRKYEIDIAIQHFPPIAQGTSCQVLELGAGTGQQAKYLSDKGYSVFAIDLPSSSYKDTRILKIKEYDGKNIPAENEQFDVVFSSNVLEHVVHIDDVLQETHRVLKKKGIAIHIIPSPSCRIWSIPAHYIWLAKRIIDRLTLRSNSNTNTRPPRTPASTKEWLNTFFPLRHGERGNTLTEIYFFSQLYWKRKFKFHKFATQEILTNDVFYTMANALGSSLNLETRKNLSKFLGASCSIYVLTKK